MRGAIKNVVFDMGQVLIRFDRAALVGRLGLPPADGRVIMNEVLLSREWVQLDWGELTDEQAVESICARVPERLWEAVRRTVLHWDEPIVPVPGMAALTEELKAAGYGLYLLSNASFRQPEYWPRVPGAALFDGTVISAQERCVKPERGIYETLFARYGLAPETCFFVDDAAANVVGGMRCGMDGAVFHGDANELRLHMRAVGIQVAAAG